MTLGDVRLERVHRLGRLPEGASSVTLALGPVEPQPVGAAQAPAALDLQHQHALARHDAEEVDLGRELRHGIGDVEGVEDGPAVGRGSGRRPHRRPAPSAPARALNTATSPGLGVAGEMVGGIRCIVLVSYVPTALSLQDADATLAPHRGGSLPALFEPDSDRGDGRSSHASMDAARWSSCSADDGARRAGPGGLMRRGRRRRHHDCHGLTDRFAQDGRRPRLRPHRRSHRRRPDGHRRQPLHLGRGADLRDPLHGQQRRQGGPSRPRHVLRGLARQARRGPSICVPASSSRTARR